MRILISGSTGFIGTKLCERLIAHGHTVVRLVRDSRHPGIVWDPYTKQIDRSRLEGFDAVINLSGESISGRWTSAKKKAIPESRIAAGEFLAELIAGMKQKPSVYISASAIGYYGERHDEELTEASAAGNDFLADVCVKWEAVAKPIASQGVRVVNVRTGIVLSPDGGALEQLLLPFKLGAGGPIGSGKQWWSWIGIEDMLAIYEFVLTNNISGAVNAVSPNAITNKQFVKTLGKVMGRPSFMPLPSFAVKLLLGEMGDALLLTSQHVIPKALNDAGFSFKEPDLKGCLKDLLD